MINTDALEVCAELRVLHRRIQTERSCMRIRDSTCPQQYSSEAPGTAPEEDVVVGHALGQELKIVCIFIIFDIFVIFLCIRIFYFSPSLPAAGRSGGKCHIFNILV